MNVNTMLTNWTVLTSFFNDLWSLTYRKKTEKKPEDRCKKDRPARGPKGAGPRPPEDRKLQDRNITIHNYISTFQKIANFSQNTFF